VRWWAELTVRAQHPGGNRYLGGRSFLSAARLQTALLFARRDTLATSNGRPPKCRDVIPLLPRPPLQRLTLTPKFSELIPQEVDVLILGSFNEILLRLKLLGSTIEGTTLL